MSKKDAAQFIAFLAAHKNHKLVIADSPKTLQYGYWCTDCDLLCHVRLFTLRTNRNLVTNIRNLRFHEKLDKELRYIEENFAKELK